MPRIKNLVRNLSSNVKIQKTKAFFNKKGLKVLDFSSDFGGNNNMIDFGSLIGLGLGLGSGVGPPTALFSTFAPPSSTVAHALPRIGS